MEQEEEYKMSVFEACVLRRSCRKFNTNVPVEWDKIGTILEAGKYAPSAGNLQNWKFILVQDKGQRDAVAEACLKQHWIAEAPIIIVVVAEPKKAEQHYGIRGERLYSAQNCAACAENMILTATSLGLSTCWVGAFIEEKLKDILSCPPEVRPQIVIPIGYSDEEQHIPQKYYLENLTYFGGYANRIKDINAVLGFPSHKVQMVLGMARELLEKGAQKTQKNLGDITKIAKEKIKAKVDEIKQKAAEKKAQKKKK